MARKIFQSKMRIYDFRPYDYPLLTHKLINLLIKSRNDRLITSFSLGKDFNRVYKSGSIIKCPELNLEIDINFLSDVIKDGFIYAIIGDKLCRLDFYKNGKYYKLLPVDVYTAPTLEISGIHMHRISGITPWEDARAKVCSLGNLRGKVVLDVCTGLGYTCIHLLLRGALHVITIEKDVNVLELAKFNPWSRELLSDKVKIIIGDASKVISSFADSQFDVIIHDPPRLAIAGELYSNDFYMELYRVLKPGGKLFHYVGKPGYKVRRIKLMENICGRLKRIGFKVKPVHNILGLCARKLN